MEMLQQNLNLLWTGIIVNHRFDLFRHTIIFNVKTIEGGKEHFYDVRFVNVNAFAYVNDQMPSEPEEGEYLELTSLVATSSSSINGTMNFSIEIWNREMTIEASAVEVNGVLFT